jgi:hypothetical protein
MSQAHHRGSFPGRSKRLKATATELTTCWKCDRRLNQVPPDSNGKPATWVAGHVRAGDPTSPLRLECSACSNREGSQLAAFVTTDWSATATRRW